MILLISPAILIDRRPAVRCRPVVEAPRTGDHDPVTDDGTPPSDDPAAYGDAFADVYDHWYHDVTDAEATARFVAARCPGGVVVEVGVGTGRLARPLLAAGLAVIGLDASAPMLTRCREHGRPADLSLVRADMTAMPLGPPVGAVLIAFNTLFNVTTAAGQQEVFHQAAQLLAPDGVLIVETLDAGALDQATGTSIGVRHRSSDGVTLVATTVSAPAQTITGRHVEIDDDGVRIRPWQLRWAPVDELDQFAATAGLGLVERHPHWSDGPAGEADTGVQISVYGRRPTTP